MENMIDIDILQLDIIITLLRRMGITTEIVKLSFIPAIGPSEKGMIKDVSRFGDSKTGTSKHKSSIIQNTDFLTTIIIIPTTKPPPP
jgi:hypothetical protein